MSRIFNVNGVCIPEKHYMVNLESRLKSIKHMIDMGEYFSINRARQYGKTTMLRALSEYLREDYVVVRLDFQKMSAMDFADEYGFVRGLARETRKAVRAAGDVPDEIKSKLSELTEIQNCKKTMADIFDCFSIWCERSAKPIVLMIDEADTATNNQVFFDFLSQIRAYYLDREYNPTFQSVILAGVYDVRNIKRKIRGEEEHRANSPWNIAADFLIDMNFSKADIAGMLQEYENEHCTGMNICEISGLIYDYTGGYPYLVSRICKLLDERVRIESVKEKTVWTKDGFLLGLKILLNETNPLYLSLKGKLEDYPELRTVLYELLFTGKPIPYTAMNDYIESAAMFGFIKNVDGTAVITNRIFETVLYNWFMSEEYISSKIYDVGLTDRNQFIKGGHLNIRHILEKFVEAFDYLYGDRDERFLEDMGRRYFMLFLKPIINGIGNCYVEAETRNRERMDLVIDYLGEQYIVELKIWRGTAYNERGEEQLSSYLDYFQLKKGYMLSFNFNKNKQIGVKDIVLGDKVLVEAVV